MSFQSLNKDVLQQVADEFAVEWTNENPTKNQMLKDLDEEGITWAMYKQAFPDPEDEPEVEDEPVDEDDDPNEEDTSQASKKFSAKPKEVLVKMTRANPTYEVRGYFFTKTHPFLPVSPDDADFLVDTLGGFKIASPREVEEFYS